MGYITVSEPVTQLLIFIVPFRPGLAMPKSKAPHGTWIVQSVTWVIGVETA
jgi:hypothetical protein